MLVTTFYSIYHSITVDKSVLLSFLISSVFFARTPSACSQQVYKTHKGIVKITAVINDSVYTLISNQLKTTLFKETMDIEMRLDLKALPLSIDSLREYIRNMDHSEVILKGKIKGTFQPEGISVRPPPKSKVIGKLYAGDIKKALNFFITIEPITKDGGIISAVLTTNFSLPVKHFHLDRYISGIRDEIGIDIKQDLY